LGVQTPDNRFEMPWQMQQSCSRGFALQETNQLPAHYQIASWFS
jgi:hypothetical protein